MSLERSESNSVNGARSPVASGAQSSEQRVPEIDRSVPHSARVWNYWLGGKDNFEVDRAVGDRVRTIFPTIVQEAGYARAFLGRAVRYLAGEAGIRQFLDIGTGLPTANNTHEVAQRIAPDARIVYLDNDPMVLVHARALLTSTPEGVTQYVDADLHDPDLILRQAARTLDFNEPVAIMLIGIIGHVGDDDEAQSIIKRLIDAVPAGSYLVLSDGTDVRQEAVDSIRQYNESRAVPYNLRSPERLARLFDGLELIEPGLVPRNEWRPDADTPQAPSDGMAGVARRP